MEKSLQTKPDADHGGSTTQFTIFSSEFSVKLYQNFSNFTFCFLQYVVHNQSFFSAVYNNKLVSLILCIVLYWNYRGFLALLVVPHWSVLQTLSSFVNRRQMTHGKWRSTQIYSRYPHSIIRGRIKLDWGSRDLVYTLLYPIMAQ